jgi:glycosyltransferase involved in cell wall biosynthesis
MNVLFFVRKNHKKVNGGDLVQIYKTAEALKNKGVKIYFSSDPNKDLSKYDLVHIFNSPRFDETKKFFESAKKRQKPIAFSTIYWSKDELGVGVAKNKSVDFIYKNFGVNSAIKYRKFAKALQSFGSKDNSAKIEKWLFENADILLPNSKGEMLEIEKSYKIKNEFEVVRNAVDIDLFDKKPNYNRESYVLSVGRIERRKNTLKLIEACHKLSYKLVLIGGYDGNDDYATSCLKKIKEYKQTYIQNIDQKDLLKYYYDAKVHAIVSWYETPGLASLEAACGGCNIVSTDRGSTKEYFGGDALYCSPFSQDSITDALEKAMHNPSNTRLRDKVLKKYNWEGTAQDTIKGYNRIV